MRVIDGLRAIKEHALGPSYRSSHRLQLQEPSSSRLPPHQWPLSGPPRWPQNARGPAPPALRSCPLASASLRPSDCQPGTQVVHEWSDIYVGIQFKAGEMPPQHSSVRCLRCDREDRSQLAVPPVERHARLLVLQALTGYYRLRFSEMNGVTLTGTGVK